MKRTQMYFFSLLFFIAFLIYPSNDIYAQLIRGDVTFSIQSGRVSLNDYTDRNAFGINLDIALKHNLGIHYNFSFGKRYFHSNLAPIGGFYVMREIFKDENASIGSAILLGVLFSLIPEGVSYNIAFNNQIGVSPYISPLQFDFIRNENQSYGKDAFAGGALGVKFNFLISEKYRISPFGEYKIHYNKYPHTGFFYGIDIGYRIVKPD